MGGALQALAAQSGAPLLFAEQTAAGKRSPPLKGRYTTAEAAEKLLAGSGLTYALAGDGAVAVRPAAAPSAGEDIDLPTINVTDEFDRAAAREAAAKRYAVTNATSATRTDTPILETPVSIQVIPPQVIKDQQVIKIEDALNNVSGVFQSDIDTGISKGTCKLRPQREVSGESLRF